MTCASRRLENAARHAVPVGGKTHRPSKLCGLNHELRQPNSKVEFRRDHNRLCCRTALKRGENASRLKPSTELHRHGHEKVDGGSILNTRVYYPRHLFFPKWWGIDFDATNDRSPATMMKRGPDADEAPTNNASAKHEAYNNDQQLASIKFHRRAPIRQLSATMGREQKPKRARGSQHR